MGSRRRIRATMSIVTYAIFDRALIIETTRGHLELTPFTPQTIRVRFGATPDFCAEPGPIVTAEPDPTTRFVVRESSD